MSAQRNDSYIQMFLSLDRAINQKIDQRECDIVSDWRALVVSEAADRAATDAGLEGAAKEQFINGFEGWDIKACNPRKLGLLAEFKAGVAARNAQKASIEAATRHAYLASLMKSEIRRLEVDAAGLPSNLR